MPERAVKLGLPALLTYNQGQKGPGASCNWPGVWPNLRKRSDVTNTNAPTPSGDA